MSTEEVSPAQVGVANGHVVALRGRIDNLSELHSRLDRALEISQGSAIQVVAASLVELGTKVFSRLRGAFSLLISDGTRLWAVRDQVGFRPLVMLSNAEAVFFATEPKQIVAGASISYEPDLEVLERSYFSRLGDDRRTAIRGVTRVGQGHFVVADVNRVASARYWHPNRLLEAGPRYSQGELQERFDGLMTQAVSRALVGSDVISLSGGVDSPAIAAYAAPIFEKRHGSSLPALSTVYPSDPSVDETRYIAAAADALGLELNTYESRARPTDGMERWVHLLDGPVPVVSLAETLEHNSKARSLGHRNMLTGSFAEYVFDAQDDLLEYLFARGRVGAALTRASFHRRHGSNTRSLARRALRACLPAWFLWGWRDMRGLRMRVPGPDWVVAEHLAEYPRLSGRQIWPRNQVAALSGPTPSLDANDVIQSLTGVEVVRPFADLDLWEFFLRLPADLKYPPATVRKPLARSLLRGRVPDLLLDRRDKTFFDEAILKRIDYECLERWIDDREFRLPGVRYDRLVDRIRRRDLSLLDFMWAKDLAGVHAFVAHCRG